MPRKYPSTPRPPLPNNPEFLVPYDDIHWQAPPPVAIPLPPLLPLPMYPLHIHAFVHYPPQPALPPDNMYPENNLPNQEYDDLGDPNNDLDPYDPEENDGPEGAIKAEGANESQEADEEEDADETEDAVEIDFCERLGPSPYFPLDGEDVCDRSATPSISVLSFSTNHDLPPRPMPLEGYLLAFL